MMILLASRLCVFFVTAFHPFHVSVTEVYHNEEKHVLEVTVKFFVGDLAKAVNKKSAASIDLYKSHSDTSTKKLIAEYLAENFSVTVNQKPVKLNYLGNELENDAIWCYLESPSVGAIGEIHVTNKALLAVYDDQMNRVNFKEGNKVRGFQLHSGHESDGFHTDQW